MLEGRKILITGGTGTLGKELVRQLLKSDHNEIVVFSRNEVSQVEMKRGYPDAYYVIGDVRDKWAVECATKGVDVVLHMSAIKHVPLCEKQPQEALETNVLGTLNIIRESIRAGVKRVVNMSTDKAVDPISFYGLTKATTERLSLQANEISDTEFISIRSGNIFGSSGSVIPFFVNQVKQNNSITLTDGSMTRFFILVQDLAEYIIKSVDFEAGKIYCPDSMKSFKMATVAEAVKELYGNKDTVIKEIGIRKGEKMHEFLNGVRSDENPGTIEELKELFLKWQ